MQEKKQRSVGRDHDEPERKKTTANHPSPQAVKRTLKLDRCSINDIFDLHLTDKLPPCVDVLI